LQEKSLEKFKYNSMPNAKYFFEYFLAQDLLVCHFGSLRAKSAILAVSLAIAHLAKPTGSASTLWGSTTHPL
jgi:hypothetical protein